MENQHISYNSARILLSHERKKKAVLDIYPTRHLLTYVREGVLQVKRGREQQCFTAGEFVLFKKFTQATITKTWCSMGNKFSSLVFTFHEDLVQDAQMQLGPLAGNQLKITSEPILPIPSNPLLEQFIQSLQLFFEQGIPMDAPLARLKTLEALLGLMRANAGIAYQLQHFSVRSKADLHQFMQHHFLENRTLAEFARESGRSLSAFKRDFTDVFGMPPHRWLKEKRLDWAYQRMLSTGQKPSEVYLNCGFEDLAHFSKSFKAQFNINPSRLLLG